MTLREEVDKGYDGRFTFKELVESPDLTPKEKDVAEVVRVEGIRRRWLVPGDKVLRMVKRENVEDDVEFLIAVIEGLRRMCQSIAQRGQQAELVAKRLIKEKVAERAESKIVAPSGRDMRAVLASREGK